MNRTARLTSPWVLGALILLTATIARDAAARTWVASPDGTSGDGTVAVVLPQLEYADSLRLLPGDHDWPILVVPPSMTLIGDEGSVVTGEGVQFQDTDFVRIKSVVFARLVHGLALGGLTKATLEDCVYRDCPAAVQVILVDTCEVTRTRFEENQAQSVSTPGGLLVGSGVLRIEQCTFANNRSRLGAPWDEDGIGGGALMVDLDTYATIRGCVFEHNEAGSGSAVHSMAREMLFEENTVVGNRDESGAVVIHVTSHEPHRTVIRQNVFADNAAFGLWVGDTVLGIPRVYCNAFWQNNTIGIGDFSERENRQWRAPVAHGYEGETDYHSTHADPMFCDSLVVHKESDLADQEHPCEPIGGARGFGCVVNPTRSVSWGELKDLLGR